MQDVETKRRYSEFESFRKALTLLHPALIVPPIPEKHSLGKLLYIHIIYEQSIPTDVIFSNKLIMLLYKQELKTIYPW